MEEPKYYRARVTAIKEALTLTTDKQERAFLIRGYMPGFKPEKPIKEDNSPLEPLEIMTWDTWFAMHPEKVCGTVRTTNHFVNPIYLKGTKEEVETKILQNITSVQMAMAELELLNLNF